MGLACAAPLLPGSRNSPTAVHNLPSHCSQGLGFHMSSSSVSSQVFVKRSFMQFLNHGILYNGMSLTDDYSKPVEISQSSVVLPCKIGKYCR